jgi:TatD DNase family protein
MYFTHSLGQDKPMFTDAHCHLADPRLEASLSDVIARSKEVGVTGWIQGGVSPDDWQRQSEIKRKYEAIKLVYGLHPWWVSSHTVKEVDEAYAILEKRLREAVALGELGLDLGERHGKNVEHQKIYFIKQITLAKKQSKPMVLHLVKCHGEALEILKKYAPYPQRGLVHSFTGSKEVAQEYIKLGFLISVCATAKKDLASIPAEALVIETDSPDQGMEKGLNEPKNLVVIAKKVADYRQVQYEDVLAQSKANLEKVFGT